MNEKILIVDDDPNLLRVTSYQLTEAGYDVTTASNGEKAEAILNGDTVDLLLTDVKMPDMDGMELLKRAQSINPDMPVILITAFAEIESAVEAIKDGAVDYIPKPFKRDDLLKKIDRALEATRLRRENISLKQELAHRDGLDEIVGASAATRMVIDTIAQVAPSDSTVLILGESGTGKELMARALHKLSLRAARPFVPINCAAIPANLLESELFGHVRGAFTGAIRNREGVFRQAHRGTLFLDEVGDIALDLQPKLLRVLQERELTMVGGTKTEKVDVRIIAATKFDLKDMVERGLFREDLYYRLNVIPIEAPPLRDRLEDIPLLADHFLKKHFPDRTLKFSTQAMETMEEYYWPGNIRELENLVQRMGVMVDMKKINVEHLPPDIMYPGAGKTIPSSKTLKEVERDIIIEALENSNWNQTAAAKRLGIRRHVLIYRIKKYSIEIP